MSKSFKITLWLIMTSALSFGFFHHMIDPEALNFERLHIFLFNLVSGGTLLIYFTEGKRELGVNGRLFLALSLLFAFCAFIGWYPPTLLLAFLLAIIVERVRHAHFGHLIPWALFRLGEPTSKKFHQASLLCLSLALCLSILAIINEQYTHWFELKKLTLNTFFLGFSFPVSLISMSAIFALMHKAPARNRYLKELSFWTINLGVIVFFLFILGGLFLPQVLISVILFSCVCLILHLYTSLGLEMQQKAFLTSGIVFLMVTSITGIVYIMLAFSGPYDEGVASPLLRLHAFTALYGWNLSGLAVISRHGDFPIRLHSHQVILLHWLTVLLLCPLGYFYAFFAVLAAGCYAWLLSILFFNHGRVDNQMIEAEEKVLGNQA